EKRECRYAEQREPLGSTDRGGEEQQRERWEKGGHERHGVLPERRRWVAAAKPGPVTRRPEEVVQRVAVDHDVAGRLQREHQEYSEGEGELAGPRCRTPQRDRHERYHIWERREADQQAGRDRRSRQERAQTCAAGRFVGLEHAPAAREDRDLAHV